MDRRFLVGMLKDWGIALGVAALVFVLWNVFAGGPRGSGSAPDFTLDDLEGTSFTLSELQGQPVVLNFWATWCGPCRAEIPELTAFHQEHPEVVLLGISVDDRLTTSAVARHAERLGIAYPVLHDRTGVVADPYRVNVLPTTIVVDDHGHIVATHVGALDRDGLEAMLAGHLAEAPAAE